MELLNLAYQQIYRLQKFCKEYMKIQELMRLKSFLLCQETYSKECEVEFGTMRLPESGSLLSHELTKDRRQVSSIFYRWGKDFLFQQDVYFISRNRLKMFY